MITGIQLCGRGIPNRTALTFFPNNTQRVALVYGRNGSGKTTIGEAFGLHSAERVTEAGQECPSRDLEAQLLIGGMSQNAVPEQLKLTTLVFNESFIEENVKLRSDGLRTLVLLGKAGKLQGELDLSVADQEKLERSHDTQVELLNAASAKSDKSRKNFEDALRAGWADRERLTKGNKNNSKVNESTLQKFVSLAKPDEAVAELAVVFEQEKARLLRTRAGEEIAEEVPSSEFLSAIKARNEGLFAESISPPSGEGIVLLVVQSLQTHGELVHRASEVFDGVDIGHCPMCQQGISDEYRSELLTAIASAVDREAEQFRTKLELSRIDSISFRIGDALRQLDPALSRSVDQRCNELNTAIQRWNDALKMKAMHLYAPLPFDGRALGDAITELERALTLLQDAKSKWNKDVQGARRLEKSVLVLNDHLTRAEVDGVLEDFLSSQETFTKAASDLKAAKVQVDDNQRKVDGLRRQLRRTDVAAEEINNNMALVFADAKRLRVEVEDSDVDGGVFMLKSRGRDIPPHRLSVGERNILAICYFFTLLKQMLSDDLQIDKTLLVLDDPISSVDIDNRIGILSFLESQLTSTLNIHGHAKVLIMTHDVGAFHDLGKLVRDVLQGLPAPHQGEWKSARWILQNRGSEETVNLSLERHDGKVGEPLHEYKTLIEMCFDYARATEPSAGGLSGPISIGNALRRVFEAFSVFIYDQTSITSSRIIEALNDLEKGELALPIRQALVTVMHGGSHGADRMMTLADFGLGAAHGDEEHLTTVRRILALMFALQPQHMRHYLGQEAIPYLDEWADKYLWADRASRDPDWNSTAES